MKQLLTEIQRLDEEQGSKRYMHGLKLVDRLFGLVGPLPELVTGVIPDGQPVAVVLGVIKTAIHVSFAFLKTCRLPVKLINYR